MTIHGCEAARQPLTPARVRKGFGRKSNAPFSILIRRAGNMSSTVSVTALPRAKLCSGAGKISNARAESQVIELGICAYAIVADQQADSDIGVGGHEGLNQWQNRIIRGGDAKQYFVARIVQIKTRTQRVHGIIVEAA